jgi:hypothetical protein
MARIIYFAFPTGRIQGGLKMIYRHVETLRELGFDAIFSTNPDAPQPHWMDHTAPVAPGVRIQNDDIVVLPEDASNALAQVSRRPPDSKIIVFCQNQYILAGLGTSGVDQLAASRPLTIMAVGVSQSNTIRRMYPTARIEVVPCFADERRFRLQTQKSAAIAYVPKKRSFEPQAIQGFFRKLHPRHQELAWRNITDMREDDVAQAFGQSGLYLSLSRLESVGMATLEAMACGCICAGFTGQGGREYATADNGFWAEEDDCEGAADNLAEAADLLKTGGPALARYQDAVRTTADAWSYARFRTRLEEMWMDLAPEARLRNGPL